MNDAQPAEVMVTRDTAERLWWLAVTWNCSVDEALERAVTNAADELRRTADLRPGEHA